MPNRVFDAQIEDNVNYLLAGPQTVGQDTKGYWNYGGGYLQRNVNSNVPPINYPPFIGGPAASFNGNIDPFTAILTVNSVDYGTISVNDWINNNPVSFFGDITPGTYVVSQLSGTPGGVGTYQCNQSGSGINEALLAFKPYYQPSFQERIFFATPAYVNVRTTSVTDSVLVTGQFRPFIRWYPPDTNANIYIEIQVNRYKLINPSIPYYIDYITYVKIASDNNALLGVNYGPLGVGDVSIGETIFASVVDKPDPGYYAYALDIQYYWDGVGVLTPPILEWIYGENIGITAAVIKI